MQELRDNFDTIVSVVNILEIRDSVGVNDKALKAGGVFDSYFIDELGKDRMAEYFAELVFPALSSIFEKFGQLILEISSWECYSLVTKKHVFVQKREIENVAVQNRSRFLVDSFICAQELR